jgi:membrane protein DedA with SNARE-associated domain
MNLATTWWAYILLFLVVAASWAGVPFVGATGLTAASVAASQGQLNLVAVIVVATAGGEAGGLLGYAVGDRWGRRLLERPGKHQAGRQRLVERGEAAYARWGPVAVFVTPAVVSGTAKMRHGLFALWNLVASFAFALAVAASAYGISRLLSGSHTGEDIASLVLGLLVGSLIMVRHRRRVAARRAESDPA